jgi:3-methyladenine DNA glycosylase/8-oxoguanine DNA glycosylase
MAQVSTSEAPRVDMRLDLGFEVDAQLTLSPLRHGVGDPTIRFEPDGVVWRAQRWPSGDATVRLQPSRDGWRVTAWGDAASEAVEALPRLLGAKDDPAALILPPGFLRDLSRRFALLRFGRSDDVMGSLVPAIIEQKVTGIEARRSYRRLVLRYGRPAPGPGGLFLPPSPDSLAALPYFELHPLGLEQRRASTLIRAAQRAAWLQEGADLGPTVAMTRLRAIPGIGAWTAAETTRAALGDPDAVSLGDYHTPSLVSWVLAGEPRADDDRMLELLEPYRGQRARLVRMLELSGVRPPAYGPRRRLRSIAAM